MNPIRMRSVVIFALACLALSGCALDPYTRPGVWRPSAVNETNLRAMVADPRDLQQGVDAPGANGTLAANAVQRLLEDRVRPLPNSSTNVTGGGTGQGGN